MIRMFRTIIIDDGPCAHSSLLDVAETHPVTTPGEAGALLDVRLKEDVCEMLRKEGEQQVGAVLLHLELPAPEELLDQDIRVRQLLPAW